MDILYISQTDIDLDSYSIYSDFARAVSKNHNLTVVSISSKIEKTYLCQKDNIQLIRVKAGNQFGVNLVKKALIMLSLKSKMKGAINKYLKNNHFDLVVYFTPPITFAGVVKYCKKKFNCKSYLMLKDIFPQNAIDLNMLKTTGLKGFAYKYFKAEEKKLYTISDKIGCMSEMNMSYLLEKNPYIEKDKVEYFPNSAIIRPLKQTKNKNILKKYNISEKNITFIYGGNLGKPQGLNHFADCLELCKEIPNIQFIVVGKGSEKKLLFEKISNLKNVLTLDALSPEDYNELCMACDVGLVLLDKNFTIPNYPSRMLSYMENAKPMLACVDRNNDVPELIKQAECGTYCYSEEPKDFVDQIKWFIDNKSRIKEMGLNGRKYYENHFDVYKYIYKLENVIKEK